MDSDSSYPISARLDIGMVNSTPSPPITEALSASSSQSQPSFALAQPSQSVLTPTSATSNRQKTKQKKVRFACERCRYRRVKCDGQVPACGNCYKAGTPCIDVDSRDSERRLIRGSADQAAARIAWLEEIIRTNLPHINLGDESSGLGQVDNLNRSSTEILESSDITTQSTSLQQTGDVSQNIEINNVIKGPDYLRGTKRPSSEINIGSVFSGKYMDKEARSVALELGLLSLNSDSRQIHYLGSSSGTLFGPLFLTKTFEGGIEPDFRDFGSSNHNFRHRVVKPLTTPGMPTTICTPEDQKALDALHEKLKKALPPRQECNILLDRFFSHMFPNHPFLHRPSFKCVVDALYDYIAEPTHSSAQNNGWSSSVKPFPYNGEEDISGSQKTIPISIHVAAFQLLLALSIGATLQIRSRRYSHNPKIFFQAATSLSNHVFGTISLPILQSILLVVVHSLIDPDGYDVWTLIHIAMAHAVDLGIHREASKSGLFGSTAIEIRRRVFYCIYSLDRSISTIQGRPLTLGDDTFDVNLPEISSAQSHLPCSDTFSTEFDDTATMSYSVQTFRMAQLVSKIKSRFYPFSVHRDAQDFTIAREELRVELGNWLAESTTIVTTTVPEEQRLRLTTKLEIQYHNAICLLHQPSQAINFPDEDALKVCYSSATQRLHLFEVLYDAGALCHSWRTVQDMFLAGATIMYCVCISPTLRFSVSILSLSKDFRSCSNMLSVGGEWWPTIRKAKYSLERLSNYILEMLAANPNGDGTELRARQTPFPHDYYPTIPHWPGSESTLPITVQQSFLSAVNHDGRLFDFFDDTLANVLLDGMQGESANHGDMAFWAGFDNTMFTDWNRSQP